MAHRHTRSSLPQKLTGGRPGYDHDSSPEESAVRTSPTAVNSRTTSARKTTWQVGTSTARYALRSSSKRPSVTTPAPNSTSTSAEGGVVQVSSPQSNMTSRGQEQDITRVTPIISGQTAVSGETQLAHIQEKRGHCHC